MHTAAHPLQHSQVRDPNREERIAQKRANVAAQEAAKEAERRSILHTLYMNARDFITTIPQLDAAVDKAFDDPNEFINDGVRGQNVWNLRKPETTTELMEGMPEMGKKSIRAIEAHEQAMAAAENRLNILAEELTGGKM